MDSVKTVGPLTGEAIGRPIFYEDGLQHYLDFLRQTFHYETPVKLRIGVDCANGAASVAAPALFGQLGATVRVWHAMPDGRNINKQCGAVYPEFSAKVLEKSSMRVSLSMGTPTSYCY
jgi:phosphoglucosamine mutase